MGGRNMFFDHGKKGVLVIQNDLWWDIENGEELVKWTDSSVKFKTEHGNNIMIYGSFMTIYYSTKQEKNKLIESYQLVEKNQRF